MHGPMPLDAFAALRPGPGTLTERLTSANTSDPATTAAVRAVLAEARTALDKARVTGSAVPVEVAHLDAAGFTLLGEILGEGEVKAKLTTTDGRTVRLQESVLPGLWRILDGDSETVEAADVPTVLRRAIQALPLGVSVPGDLPEGAMNVQPVIGELDDAVRAYDATGVEKEINLTLMPMTPVDLMVLDMALGMGPASLISMGYGDCRIHAGARRHTWSVRFSNTEGKEILHTVQAGDVPIAARATAEDMGDSVERLDEIMGSLFA